MFDISELNQYLVVVVIGICCCIGYLIKTSLDFIPNKYIPLILATVGVLTNVSINHGFNIEILLGGMLSGLASTGCHEAIRNLLNKSSNDTLDEEELELLEEEIKFEILEEIRQDMMVDEPSNEFFDGESEG